MAALAEFEDRVGGRPSALTPAARQAAVDLREQGKTIAEIASTLRVSRATVYRSFT